MFFVAILPLLEKQRIRLLCAWNTSVTERDMV